MDTATLVAIAVVDTTATSTTLGDAHVWPLRIERAWRWPGGGATPPLRVVVIQPSATHPCAVHISFGERQLVVASVRRTDGALILGHKCATPWGAVDTLGPMAADNRRFAGDAAVRNIARSQATILDSLRAFGPGITP